MVFVFRRLRDTLAQLTLLLILLCSPLVSRAETGGASLYLSPAKANVVAGSTFDLSILVNTAGQAINAVSVDMTFPTDKLQVVGPVANSSFVGVWVSQPTYSNTDGTIRLERGVPSPGLTSNAGNVLTVQFRARGSGQATVHFTGAKVLANDGFGTNILKTTNDAVLTVTPKLLDGPSLASTTHPDINTWYSARTAEFAWQSPEASDGLSWVFDHNPATVPGTQAKEYASTIKTLADIDGLWFFHLRLRSKTDWGAASHLGVKIDNTAPALFTPVIEPGSITINQRPVVTFATTDATSGIDHYEVKVENQHSQSTEVGLFTEEQSPYLLPLLPAGDHLVTVQAFDKAGNTQTGQATVKVLEFPAKAAADNLNDRVQQALNPVSANPIPWVIGLGLMVLLLIIIIWLLLRRRKKSVEEPETTPAPTPATDLTDSTGRPYGQI